MSMMEMFAYEMKGTQWRYWAYDLEPIMYDKEVTIYKRGSINLL